MMSLPHFFLKTSKPIQSQKICMSVSNTVTLFLLLLILALCDFPSPPTGAGPVPSRGSCVPVTQPEADAVRRPRCFMSLPALCHCPGESPTTWTNQASWESSSASCGCAPSSEPVRRRSGSVHVYVKMCAWSHVPRWINLFDIVNAFLSISSRSSRPIIWFKVFFKTTMFKLLADASVYKQGCGLMISSFIIFFLSLGGFFVLKNFPLAKKVH